MAGRRSGAAGVVVVVALACIPSRTSAFDASWADRNSTKQKRASGAMWTSLTHGDSSSVSFAADIVVLKSSFSASIESPCGRLPTWRRRARRVIAACCWSTAVCIACCCIICICCIPAAYVDAAADAPPPGASEKPEPPPPSVELPLASTSHIPRRLRRRSPPSSSSRRRSLSRSRSRERERGRSRRSLSLSLSLSYSRRSWPRSRSSRPRSSSRRRSRSRSRSPWRRSSMVREWCRGAAQIPARRACRYARWATRFVARDARCDLG